MLLFIFVVLLAEAIMAVPVNVSALNPPLASSTVFQFPNVGTWIENVAARENGDLLITMVQPKPHLYSLKGPQTPQPEMSLLFEFPNMDGLLGITEVQDDVFVVAGGQFHGEADPILGTFSLWNISFADRYPTLAKIVDLPDNVFPNGLVTVPGQRDVVLVANSLGSLLRVDVSTGTMETIAADPEMVPVPGALFPLGINGIKILDGYVWWTNSFASTIYRRRIDAAGRIAERRWVESIATLPETCKYPSPDFPETANPKSLYHFWSTSVVNKTYSPRRFYHRARLQPVSDDQPQQHRRLHRQTRQRYGSRRRPAGVYRCGCYRGDFRQDDRRPAYPVRCHQWRPGKPHQRYFCRACKGCCGRHKSPSRLSRGM